MRYTVPAILNESKATPLVTGHQLKNYNHVDVHPSPQQGPRSVIPAYEADE